MRATARPGRSGLAWWKWGVLVVAVLLAAVIAGVALRAWYGESAREDAASAGPSTARQPGKEPGSGRVELSPSAADHPDHVAVRILLQTHFNSINLKRYDRWKTTVVAEKQRRQPESSWREEYRTTQDGSIEVLRIMPGPEGSLRVMLTFTSTQHPSDAPPSVQSGCLRWRVVYPVVRDAGGLRFGVGLPDSSLARPC